MVLPLVQRYFVGAELKLCPLALPQVPFTTGPPEDDEPLEGAPPVASNAQFCAIGVPPPEAT